MFKKRGQKSPIGRKIFKKNRQKKSERRIKTKKLKFVQRNTGGKSESLYKKLFRSCGLTVNSIFNRFVPFF